jgi:class 3 adenylate cyclase
MTQNRSARIGGGSAPSENPPVGVLPPDCRTETMGVAFFDLSRLSEWSSTEQDEAVAGFFQEFYALAAEHIEPAGGRILKFLGDSGLAVFPTGKADQLVASLCEFASAARECARRNGFDAYLNVNVHAGSVLTGSFGAPGAERFDAIGKTVNVAARLGRRGVTLSTQAFRCLSEDARKRFQKVLQPITYRLRS